MRTIIAAVIACALALTIAAPPIFGAAPTPPALSIELSASPAAVAPGGDITYEIHAEGPAPQAVFAFNVPIGTALVALSDRSGLGFEEALLPDGTSVRYGDPAFAAKVAGKAVQLIFGFSPSTTVAKVHITVRASPVWQGPPIAARAYFDGTGLPQSDVVSTAVTPPALTGSLSVERFVDLNGNLQQDTGDIGETCPIYIYSDLTGIRVPDDIASPTDPRLPLVTFGGTDPSGHAGFTLAPGRYSVYTAACNVPPPPSGAPETSFDVKQQPPATRILAASGASFYDVQIVDIAVASLTDTTIGERPLGPTAAPTKFGIERGSHLTWTDNAVGEVGYHISLQSQRGQAAFDLPANASSFDFPAVFQPRCGEDNTVNISLAAVGVGGPGYNAYFTSNFSVECASPPVTAPNAGSGPIHDPQRPVLPLVVLALGVVLASAGVLLLRWRRGTERTD